MAAALSFKPTGTHHSLRFSADGVVTEAIITEVAAGLRLFAVDGVPYTETFQEDELRPFGTGIVMAPWPNRIKDGIWTYGGKSFQLDLNEPERRNALHGLLRNQAYSVTHRESNAITLATTIVPQHGYPFVVEVTASYRLDKGALTVTYEATNHGPKPAPVAFGAHPFFRIGDVPTNDLTLSLPASQWYPTDGRGNAGDPHSVDGTDFDFRKGRKVGDVQVDNVFGRLEHDAGVVVHTLSAPDGRSLSIWQDETFKWVQLLSTSKFPRPNGDNSLALAIEPSTAPPNSFSSGEGVRWLQSGERWSASWGVRVGSHM